MAVLRSKVTAIYNTGDDEEDWRFTIESTFDTNTVTIRAIQDLKDAHIAIHLSPQRAYELGSAILDHSNHVRTGT